MRDEGYPGCLGLLAIAAINGKNGHPGGKGISEQLGESVKRYGEAMICSEPRPPLDSHSRKEGLVFIPGHQAHF